MTNKAKKKKITHFCGGHVYEHIYGERERQRDVFPLNINPLKVKIRYRFQLFACNWISEKPKVDS